MALVIVLMVVAAMAAMLVISAKNAQERNRVRVPVRIQRPRVTRRRP